MNAQDFEKSLNLRDRHLCCDDAKYYLFPPRKQGTLGNTTFFKVLYWHIDLSDSMTLIRVRYCPFCGEKLEEVQ